MGGCGGEEGRVGDPWARFASRWPRDDLSPGWTQLLVCRVKMLNWALCSVFSVFTLWVQVRGPPLHILLSHSCKSKRHGLPQAHGTCVDKMHHRPQQWFLCVCVVIRRWVLAKALSTEKAFNKYLLKEGKNKGRKVGRETSKNHQIYSWFPDKVTTNCLR